MNSVEIDVDRAAQGFNHLITPEERLRVALAIRKEIAFSDGNPHIQLRVAEDIKK